MKQAKVKGPKLSALAAFCKAVEVIVRGVECAGLSPAGCEVAPSTECAGLGFELPERARLKLLRWRWRE